jgi:hypothetical protein
MLVPSLFGVMGIIAPGRYGRNPRSVYGIWISLFIRGEGVWGEWTEIKTVLIVPPITHLLKKNMCDEKQTVL